MKRRLLLSVLTAALILSLTGCTRWNETTDPLGELSEYYREQNDEPVQTEVTEFTLPYLSNKTLDPLTCSDGIQSTLTALLYEGLYELDPQFEPHPRLAANAEYDADTLTYTIILRDDAVFSDGSSVSAWDVMRSLQRAAQSERYAERLRHIADLDTQNGAVIIELTEDIRNFTARLDVPIVKDSTAGSPIPMGSGPYYWNDENGKPCLLANPSWWQERTPVLERIELQDYKGSDAATYAFTARELQLLVYDPTSSDSLLASVVGDYAPTHTATMQYLGYNTFAGFFSDPALRRAVGETVDRHSLISAYLMGHGLPTQFPIHPASLLYPAELELPHAASALSTVLKERGEIGSQIRFLVNQENTFKIAVAKGLVQTLTDAGLSVSLDILPWEEFIDALFLREYDLYLGEVKLTADWDATSLLSSDGSLNFGDFSDPDIDELLHLYRAAEESQRPLAAEHLCRQMLELSPITPLFFKENTVLTTSDIIDGITPTQADPFYNLAGWQIHLSGEK